MGIAAAKPILPHVRRRCRGFVIALGRVERSDPHRALMRFLSTGNRSRGHGFV